LPTPSLSREGKRASKAERNVQPQTDGCGDHPKRVGEIKWPDDMRILACPTAAPPRKVQTSKAWQCFHNVDNDVTRIRAMIVLGFGAIFIASATLAAFSLILQSQDDCRTRQAPAF